ncbi:MAG TPA: PP2C family protein-serine/threonine phosphatase [Jiangellaceae bacterium]|jgi:phosphoserine phosphatase RsbU/P|nr:PP2C family protein-serine/threonine phosphatase [Jiangellaceae bacterium]
MDWPEAPRHAALVDMLQRAHLCQPDELPAEINAAVSRLGLEITVYLVDYEQHRLWPLTERGKPTADPLSVDGTLAGRAFASVRTMAAGEAARPDRLWVPMIDGSERLGVAEVVLHEVPPDLADLREFCEALVGLVGHLLTVKLPYGDTLEQVRRTQPMTAAAELLLASLPPLTFSCHRLVISAVLEPSYDVGGDAYDYAVDGPLAQFMVLDAMGRGMRAGLTCVVAMAAMRTARRENKGLFAIGRAADAALVEHFADQRFVTAVLGELEMDTGRLRYINAGHPAPLLLRHGRAVRALTGGRRMPLGLDDSAIEIAEESLEPGDRLLLYTDGVTEARDDAGELFGTDHLVDLAERSAVDELPAPENLRRLAHSVMQHQGGLPTDDATIMLVEWSEKAAERTQP